ncbi:hypothetical protein NE237_026184 [Protea cynaroides]|uniref:Peptidase C14 caspase domain-containing protein n=1 Tax=Protea cynaroides TaxID=273540 RepID=A0A9Q0K2H1_9MAGN|nr:hypothetical protein NE237_026184 [Protea cynaroides]
MGKKAVLIGCNYTRTKAELKGCINDVRRMYRCLTERYDFAEDDITVLIDTDDSYTQPAGKNIRPALVDLVSFAEPGDSLFIHYSGHDTRLPAETGKDDDTGYDECIVPSDMNLITAMEAALQHWWWKRPVYFCRIYAAIVDVPDAAAAFATRADFEEESLEFKKSESQIKQNN